MLNSYLEEPNGRGTVGCISRGLDSGRWWPRERKTKILLEVL